MAWHRERALCGGGMHPPQRWLIWRGSLQHPPLHPAPPPLPTPTQASGSAWYSEASLTGVPLISVHQIRPGRDATMGMRLISQCHVAWPWPRHFLWGLLGWVGLGIGEYSRSGEGAGGGGGGPGGGVWWDGGCLEGHHCYWRFCKASVQGLANPK